MSWLATNSKAIAAAADIVSIMGGVTIIIAAWSFVHQQRETRRQRAFERTKLSLELMARYYDDSEFDEIRTHLWQRTSPERTKPNRLTRGEIRLLNYFEALGLAVNQGVLDTFLVGRMLGAPLRQLAENPRLGPYVSNPRHSYEGICELWEKLQITPLKR